MKFESLTSKPRAVVHDEGRSLHELGKVLLIMKEREVGSNSG